MNFPKELPRKTPHVHGNLVGAHPCDPGFLPKLERNWWPGHFEVQDDIQPEPLSPPQPVYARSRAPVLWSIALLCSLQPGLYPPRVDISKAARSGSSGTSSYSNLGTYKTEGLGLIGLIGELPEEPQKFNPRTLRSTISRHPVGNLRSQPWTAQKPEMTGYYATK